MSVVQSDSAHSLQAFDEHQLSFGPCEIERRSSHRPAQYRYNNTAFIT